MQTTEELIRDILAHADPNYDPQKAHEYYLRTRQLVGRQPGAVTSPGSRPSSGNTGVVGHPKGPSIPKTPGKTKQQQVEAQVAALQARFDKLKKILATLVAAAKARSGVAPSKTTHKPPTKETAAQKHKQSEAAKKYYEKHKNDKPQTPDQQLKALQQKIKDVQAKIKKLQDEAAAAKKHPTHRSTPKPGPVGKTKQT